MEQIPVIIDCDPGADDSLGMLLALYSPRLSVLGITAVCGNAPVAQTALNATKVLRLAGQKDIQVYCGAEQPLKRSLEFSTKYSGADGLCETGLIEAPELLSDISAAEYLIKTLKYTEIPITLIATAGFTNLAQALKQDPSIKNGIKEIVAAAGYYGMNQKECRAEWNIEVDPEAADLVFASEIPIRAIGLDVTCMLKDTYTEQVLAESTGKIADFLKKCDAYNRRSGLSSYSLLVDGMATAAVVEPEIARYQTGRVKVNPDQKGADQIKFTITEGNVKAADQYDMKRYIEMIKGMIRG